MSKAKAAFAFDIDGVLWRWPNIYHFSKPTLKKVMSHRIPFVLLTNGGGMTEAQKTSQINERLDMNEIKEDQVILSHTPLKTHLSHFENKLLLVGGNRNIHNVAHNYGLRRAINISEIINANPDIYPYPSCYKEGDSHRKIDDIIKYDPKNVEAIAIMHEGECWGSEIQVVVDALIYGKKAKNLNHPLIYFTNPDLLWTTSYFYPRFAQGIYAHCIKSIYEKITKMPLQHVQFGKPSKYTYDYAHEVLIKQAKNLGYDGVEQFYMIGDNPTGDIIGANNAGWNSILVKTGVYIEGQDHCNPTIIVDNVEQGVKWALQRHDFN